MRRTRSRRVNFRAWLRGPVRSGGGSGEVESVATGQKEPKKERMNEASGQVHVTLTPVTHFTTVHCYPRTMGRFSAGTMAEMWARERTRCARIRRPRNSRRTFRGRLRLFRSGNVRRHRGKKARLERSASAKMENEQTANGFECKNL